MKYGIILLCLVFAFKGVHGQKTDKIKKPIKEKLITGGDLILSIGNSSTQVGLSPILGYKVSERYIAGIGITYIYGANSAFTSNLYGGRIFNRFFVLDQLFLHAEAERTNYELTYKLQRDKVRSGFPAVLVGGGYRNSVGGNSYVSISVLYDILQDPRSLYVGPILRGGVNIGF